MAKKQIIEFDPDTQDAVIYTRYSSHNQRDCSIEQQVADCEIFARQNNLRVVKVYADRHLSGTTDNRPQFQQMLKDASHGHWAYVICWKIDRFARNRYDSATYKFRLKKAGVRVLYAKESIPDGPEGILLESVLEGSAEYYSAALAQNIRRGMKYNAEQCKVNSGSIPFGYCKGPDGRFAIHEANAEVVREIFRKAAAGMPFVDIANDLNSRGLKTSRGGRWNKGSFRLLMNEAYIGVYHFSDTRIEGGMPALIDQGTFWAANERLKANSSVRGRHQDGGDYLLTGKLKCAHCGSYMIGFSGTGKSGELHYYYGCQKRRRERACKKANVPREWIERVVVKAALDYVLRPDVMEWIADAVMEYQEREAASAQLAALTAELEENQKATDNVMKAIEAGIITSTTKQRLLDLEAKAQDLKRAIELEKLSHVRLERDQVLFWLDRFRGGSLQSQEFRRKVIDAFVSVVYLSDDHLRIAFNYSGGSNAEADFDLVMDAEAAAGELSKKFAQGHVTSTIKDPPSGHRPGDFFAFRPQAAAPGRKIILNSPRCSVIIRKIIKLFPEHFSRSNGITLQGGSMKRRFFAAVLLLVLAAALLCPAAFASGSFTIYFETGGGTGIPVIATTTASGKLSSLPEPTMTGYRFEGWYTDTLEGDKITLNTEFGADTTIYAHWLPLSDRQTSQTQTAPPAQTAALNNGFSLKAHAGTILVAGTMLVTLFVLYG